MYEPIAFISLIHKIKEESIPFELTTKTVTTGVNKAFITFPFMGGDIALLCYDLLEGGPDLRIESFNTPWDPENDVTLWLPEEEDINKLFQNILMFWKGYNAAH